jgi:asparagine synthetase B (glutamine-hydrolysing)
MTIRVVGDLDPNFAWDGKHLYDASDFSPAAEVPLELRGAAASIAFQSAPPSWRIIRDPLGINKLFWAQTTDKAIALASRPVRLVEQGYPFETIRAIPRASVIDLSKSRPKAEVHRIDLLGEATAPSSQHDLAARIRLVLERYLIAVADACRGANFYVCLSGGLDSSGIAALARECVPSVAAVSFDLESPRRESEDRRVARRLARDLDLPLMCVTSSPASVLEKLDLVLAEGVDWRDFNVHAALVNASIAEAIAENGTNRRNIVLTGDLANEFLADYGPERYRGTTYYELPRLRRTALRNALVRGLDTSNREVGVFAAWGVDVVQPYAVAVDLYLSIASTFLESAVGKQNIGRSIFGDLLPDYVYQRRKIRAQVGSSDGDAGVLGLCVEHDVDSQYLRDRFAHLHHVDVQALEQFIRGGTYRFGIPTFDQPGPN